MAGSEYLRGIIKELTQISELVEEKELLAMRDALDASRRVFVAGSGRSGYVAKAFANRLMHLGMSAYVAGEATTPAIAEGDLLFIVSASGETASLKADAQIALSAGAEVATITAKRDAAIGSSSKYVITLPGKIKTDALQKVQSPGQVMASAFEQMSWLVCDALVCYLMDKRGVSEEAMFARHANLE